MLESFVLEKFPGFEFACFFWKVVWCWVCICKLGWLGFAGYKTK